jgi:carnitine-CoA ligase
MNAASDVQRTEQMTLTDLLGLAAERWPDKTFLRIDSGEVTFSAFENQVASLAAGLAGAGLQSGDRLAVLMENSLACLHTWFAANRLGAVWAPINTQFRGLTLEHLCRLADPRLVVADDSLLAPLVDALERSGVEAPALVHTQQDAPAEGNVTLLSTLYLPEPAPAAPSLFSDPAALLFTSGTTGRSKACILSHQYFLEQANVLARDFELRHDDVLYCPFPLFHADATALTTVPALLLGATAAISRRFSASRFWDEVHEHGATVFDFMGATLSILYKAVPTDDDADNPVRLAWGVPVPEWVGDFERRFDLKVVELYGSVEASLPVTQPLHEPRVPGSCGRVTDGFEVEIHDADGNQVGCDRTGEIVVRTMRPSMLFDGYFANAEATVEAFRNLWFHTGDLGRVDSSGNYYFVGRIKDAIRRRGENISAYEVEEGLMLHPDIVECAVIGVPSELTEEEIKAFIVTRAQSTLTPTEVVDHARSTLARFQIPRFIEFVAELPKTPTGKITKDSLRAEPLNGRTWDREAQERR